MNKINVKNNIKMVFMLLPLLAFFLLCPWLRPERSVVQMGFLSVLIGINLIMFLFVLLLKKFDPQKTVSTSLVFMEFLILTELIVFVITDGLTNYGVYAVAFRLLFKDINLILMSCFYRSYHRESVINVWFVLILSIVNDWVCLFMPEYAIYTFAVFVAVGITVYFRVFNRNRKDQGLFSLAHISFWGFVINYSLWIVLMKKEYAVLCGFSGATLAVVVWNIIYLKEIVKNRNEEVEHAEKNLDFKNEEMRVMLSQIKPHFIYNTLNTIQYLCRTDGELAADTISDFSDYLRTNLNFDSNRQIVPFSEELEHVNKYLKIEKLRFRHRLMVKYDVQEDDFCVPTLSLQPIIENAVKHGISKRLNGGTITISTFKDEDNYVIQIKDNGVGFTENERIEKEKNPKRKSLGLRNIENRIENLLDGKLKIVSQKERGTTATILLPIDKNIEEGEKNENSLY